MRVAASALRAGARRYLYPESIANERSPRGELFDDRNADEAVLGPFHDKRLASVPYRFVVNVLARSVVDHFEQILVHLQGDRETAAFHESSAHHSHVADRNRLLHTGTQQLPPRLVARVARAPEIACEEEVPPVRHQLVEANRDIHVLLVHGGRQLTAEAARDRRVFGERLTDRDARVQAAERAEDDLLREKIVLRQ